MTTENVRTSKSAGPISNSQHTRRAKKLVRSVILLWAALAIIFAFADLQISNAVVNPRSGWARFLAAYGQEPGLLLAIVALYVVNVNREKPGGLRGAAVSVSLLLCIAFSTHVIIAKIAGEAIDDLPLFGTYACRILALLGIAALMHVLLRHKYGRFSRPTELFAQVTIRTLVLNDLLFVQITKTLWGRVRFRELDALQADFTPWYLPQGITGHRSFPSGHAAMGWMLLPLLLLVLDRGRRVRVGTGVLVIAWGLLVAVSRVVVGAHYASDVLFSSAVGVLCFLLLYERGQRD
jgi:membrane-associated phospholipid phosphatase